ncbi:Uncharacterised protein [Mycobacteroides abscessus subsp. abscessus]|nr:Uncharacterised protein [Mycobacteroides abscessus subsp. abscessus]
MRRTRGIPLNPGENRSRPPGDVTSMSHCAVSLSLRGAIACRLPVPTRGLSARDDR